MSRARNIKPGFFKNDRLAECDPLARILFSGLWCEADREGRLEDRPRRLKAELLPYDDCDVEALLGQLANRGFIVRYTHESGRYIAIPEFCKHQNPHIKETASTIPAPYSHSAKTGPSEAQPRKEPEQPSSSHADSPSLIPDSPSHQKPESPDGDSTSRGTDEQSGNVSPHPDNRTCEQVIEAYHELLPACRRVEVVNPKLQRKILFAHKLARQVCKKQGWTYVIADFWRSYFGECTADPWLRGELPNPKSATWKQNLGVLIDETRFAEIMDRAITSLKQGHAA